MTVSLAESSQLHQHHDKKNSSRWGIIPAILVVYTAVRLFLLSKIGGHVADTAELYQGFIAHDLVRGLRASLWDYQPDPYTAGSLLTGLAASLFFQCLGPSLLALRLSALTFSILGTGVLLKLLRENFGPKAMLAATPFLILMPPGPTQLSWMALGSHPESIWISSLMLLFFLRCIRTSIPSKIDVLVWGITSGLGCWLYPINTVIFFCCLFILILKLSRKFSNLSFPAVASAGFMLGFLPWFYQNRRMNGAGLQYFSDLLSFPFFSDSKTLPLSIDVFSGFPKTLIQSLFFPDLRFLPAHGLAMMYAILMLILGMFVLLAGFSSLRFFKMEDLTNKISQSECSFEMTKQTNHGIRNRSIFLVFLIIPAGLALSGVLAMHKLGAHDIMEPYRYRYFYPFHFYLAALPGIALVSARFSKLPYIILLGMNLLVYAGFLSQKPPANFSPKDLPGYLLEDPGRLWLQPQKQDHLNQPATQTRLEESIHQRSKADQVLWDQFQTWEEALRWIASQEESIQPYLFESLGFRLIFWRSLTSPPEFLFDEARDKIPNLPASFQAALAFGLGRALIEAAPSSKLLNFQLAQLPSSLTLVYGQEIQHGLGYEIKKRLATYPNDKRKIWRISHSPLYWKSSKTDL